MDRVILHCDCNSFFASVETAINPQYANVPMAVCGSEEDRHGIVLAKNELAKKYGIKTAETVYSAKRKCPSLVIASPHYAEYERYSARVNKIYSEYTDMVEPFGIDESWLDVTASIKLFGSFQNIAEEIRRRVREEIGITVSIGVSFNKVFAKLGSDYKKPDAITYILRDNFEEIVFPLPVETLLFVGKRTEETLRRLGIRTIGDLARFDVRILSGRLGKLGEMLHIYACGLDSSPVSPANRSDAKSISNGLTFRRDITSRDDWKTALEYLADEVGVKLRANSQCCTGVSLTVKDEFLKSIQRQRRLDSPTDIGEVIAKCALSILTEEWPASKPIRTLTVAAIGLVRSDTLTQQMDFFSDGKKKVNEKLERKEKTIDIIRQKFGNSSILSGAVMESDLYSFGEDET